MENNNVDNLNSFDTFTNDTKNICFFFGLSILLIIIFVISPLNNFIFLSIFFKIIILIILVYLIICNIRQTNSLYNFSSNTNNNNITHKLNLNIICGYIFTIVLIFLLIFILKSFF